MSNLNTKDIVELAIFGMFKSDEEIDRFFDECKYTPEDYYNLAKSIIIYTNDKLANNFLSNIDDDYDGTIDLNKSNELKPFMVNEVMLFLSKLLKEDIFIKYEDITRHFVHTFCSAEKSNMYSIVFTCFNNMKLVDKSSFLYIYTRLDFMLRTNQDLKELYTYGELNSGIH